MDSLQHPKKRKIPNHGNYNPDNGSLTSHHENTWKRIALIFLPQFLVCVGFILYVFLGAFAFCLIDENIAKENYTEVVLFSFTTLATIGYGNISPKTTYSRLFCLVFTTLGVPLCVVVIGNMSKHLTKAFWMIQICFGI
uniref:Potassium channel domain-containing protein n=1 Tax=Panagrolaimus sp. JU765 TaxID=591449 RepID=A0AC34RKB7_9BILA